MTEALAAAEAINEEKSRASALGSLIPHLAPEQKSKAFDRSALNRRGD